MMQIKELVIRAIKEDALDKMLVGQDEYKCEISQFIAAEVPTDWPNIIRTIYLLYTEMPDLMVDKKFEEAIKCMCNKGAFEVYCAVMVMFFQIISEERHTAAFVVDRDSIVKNLKSKLHSFEKELRTCKKWTGKKYQDGMWGDIRRVNSILNEDYAITIL
ncbi:MAG: hypothetical protein J6K53_13045 [Roseburia sp.]|nr:hypothetical protein [Roseburia sp.]